MYVSSNLNPFSGGPRIRQPRIELGVFGRLLLYTLSKTIQKTCAKLLFPATLVFAQAAREPDSAAVPEEAKPQALQIKQEG